MFGFDPNIGVINVINLMPFLVLIAGIFAIIKLLFDGKAGASIGAFIATALLFYVLSSGSMADLGKGISNLLTIGNPDNQTQTTPVIPNNPEAPVVPPPNSSD